VRKAAKIATVSSFSKRELMAAYGVHGDDIDVIYNGVDEAFRPAGSVEQARTRDRYAGGCDYFLHVGSIHPRKNVANLLLAFDRFKQRTRRPTKLLLAGRMAWKYEDVLQTHAAMEHRNDVVFLGYVPSDQLPAIVGAALAVACVSLYEGFGLPIVEAMACAVPVIASARGAMQEIAGDAALAVEPEDPGSIAAAMERIADDTALRREYARRGLDRAAQFNWDTTAAAIWSQLTRIAAASSRSSPRRIERTS
jgi:glycosyltransferase involved in cell wall biosynthesis